MSPILIRPVREQLEHDRLVRFLEARYKRKFVTAMNVGDERVAPVKIGPTTYFPDLVLTDGRKLAGLVEVETGESVNNLEALAQWVTFSRARAPFLLYVPVQAYDSARRLCEAHRVRPAEVWTYRPTNDGFDLVRLQHHPTTEPAAAPATDRTMRAPAKKVAKSTRPPKAAARKTGAKPVKKPAATKARPRKK